VSKNERVFRELRLALEKVLADRDREKKNRKWKAANTKKPTFVQMRIKGILDDMQPIQLTRSEKGSPSRQSWDRSSV